MPESVLNKMGRGMCEMCKGVSQFESSLSSRERGKFKTAVSKFHTAGVRKRGRDRAIMSVRVLYVLGSVSTRFLILTIRLKKSKAA